MFFFGMIMMTMVALITDNASFHIDIFCCLKIAYSNDSIAVIKVFTFVIHVTFYTFSAFFIFKNVINSKV